MTFDSELLSNDDQQLRDISNCVFIDEASNNNFVDEELLLTIGLNFTGSTFFESGLNPPDTMGAVGSDHIVELINGRYKVYDKDTGAVVQTSSLNQFWEDAGLSLLDPFTFDPRVLYDPFSERWFAVSANSFDVDNPESSGNFLVGVSNDSDPTLGWKGFEIEFSGFADFPTLGFNSEGIFTASGTGRALIVLPKTDLINGIVSNQTIFRQTNFVDPFQPVVDLDNTELPYPLFAPTGTTDSFLRWNINGDINSPFLDTEADLISVNPFDSVFETVAGRQPDTNKTLSLVDSRLKTNIILQNGAIWGVQDVNNNDRAAIRWFQIDADTNELLQEGLIADPGLDFYYGSIAVNDFDDVVIGFNGSGETQFVSSLAVVGDTFDGETVFSEPIVLEESTVSYENGSPDFPGLDSLQWGDYSATVVDPENPFTFWTFQTLAFADNAWSTQITEIILESDLKLDFEGSDLSAGTIITEQFTGLTISSDGLAVMIFDTANPTGGDTDLASETLGNVLILSEDGDSSDPDDNATGGTFYFVWDSLVNIDSVGLLDVEELGGSINLYGADDSILGSFDISNLTNNGGTALVDIGISDVSEMEVILSGSGAITDVNFF